MAALTMGVDVGQVADPTALVVADPDGPAGNPATRYLVRHLERLPLGTDYPVVALRIAQVAVGACSQAHDQTGVGRRVVVYLDQTGVGRPVADLVRRTVGGIPRVALVAVTITGGDQIQPRRPGELSRTGGDRNADPLAHKPHANLAPAARHDHPQQHSGPVRQAGQAPAAAPADQIGVTNRHHGCRHTGGTPGRVRARVTVGDGF